MEDSSLEVELFDGLSDCAGGGDGPYVSVGLPYEWLSDEGADRLDDVPALFVTLDELINRRLLSGPSPSCFCPPVEAAKAISALRKYADELERLYGVSPPPLGSIDFPGLGTVCTAGTPDPGK